MAQNEVIDREHRLTIASISIHTDSHCTFFRSQSLAINRWLTFLSFCYVYGWESSFPKTSDPRHISWIDYGWPSPPKIQEIETQQRKHKWFSDGLPNEISGFEMKLSKHKRLSALL